MLHAEWHLVERDVGVRLGEMEARGDFSVMECQRELDQSGDARGGLEVSDVGLHRAEAHAVLAGAALGKHGSQRACLDRVAEQGPGAVRLHVVDPPGEIAGPPVGLAEHGFLAARLGAVSPLLRPSWLTALPRITA